MRLAKSQRVAIPVPLDFTSIRQMWNAIHLPAPKPIARLAKPRRFAALAPLGSTSIPLTSSAIHLRVQKRTA